jgi:hypothetical protein
MSASTVELCAVACILTWCFWWDGQASACPVAFFLHGSGPKNKHEGKMFLNGPHAASFLVRI